MTTYFPISNTVPQYVTPAGAPYSGAVLKAYEDNTTTPIQMATDYTGATLVNTITLNAQGFPAVAGSVVVPHIAENYKLALYPDAASAAANTGAVWIVDDFQISSTASFGSLTDVASASTISLNSTTTNYFNITGTTTITEITLAEGVEVTVKFAGVLILTNGAFLILKGGANITTGAGDIAVFRGEAGGVVRMLDYVDVSVTPTGGNIWIPIKQTLITTSVGSVDFIHNVGGVVLDGTYTSYKFIVRGMNGNAGANFDIKYSTNLGGAWNSPSTNGGGIYTRSGSTTVNGRASMVIFDNASTSTSDCFSGEILLHNLASTNKYKNGTSFMSGVTSAGPYQTEVMGFSFPTISAVNGIQFLMSVGNIDDGVIELYGLKGF